MIYHKHHLFSNPARLKKIMNKDMESISKVCDRVESAVNAGDAYATRNALMECCMNPVLPLSIQRRIIMVVNKIEMASNSPSKMSWISTEVRSTVEAVLASVYHDTYSLEITCA